MHFTDCNLSQSDMAQASTVLKSVDLKEEKEKDKQTCWPRKALVLKPLSEGKNVDRKYFIFIHHHATVVFGQVFFSFILVLVST